MKGCSLSRGKACIGVVSAMVAVSGMLMSGCGGESWQASTHPAYGTVTVNGEPASGAVVELHSTGEAPDERNSRPWAIVEEDGSFTLTTYESGDGAPLGEYAVTVRWPPDVTQPSLADQLDGRYATPAKSAWSVVITEGENALPPVVIDGVALKADSKRKRSAQPPGPPLGR